jgi:hypothetical protein
MVDWPNGVRKNVRDVIKKMVADGRLFIGTWMIVDLSELESVSGWLNQDPVSPSDTADARLVHIRNQLRTYTFNESADGYVGAANGAKGIPFAYLLQYFPSLNSTQPGFVRITPR